MKKVIVAVCAALISCALGAQDIEIASITQNFQNMPADLPASTVVDTSRMVVYYQFHYPVDDLTGGFKQADDLLCLQIGHKVCKTFSYNLHLMDIRAKGKVKYRLNYTPYVVFANYPAGSITQENRIPYSKLLQGSTQIVTYEEPMPRMEWRLGDEQDSIAGYLCRAAECDFRGRTWKVWYTPELPSLFSVWKFSGLPGLILKAADTTGAYRFEATEVTAACEPIVVYNWKPVTKSRSEWMDFEKDMYAHPGKYFSKNGEISVFNSVTRQTIGATEWTVPYDPIEKH